MATPKAAPAAKKPAAPKKAPAEKAAAVAKPAAPKKPATEKKPAAKKAAAPKSATTSSSGKNKVGPEERYRMIEVAAYFLAERNSFKGNPVEYWTAAEIQIAKLLAK